MTPLGRGMNRDMTIHELLRTLTPMTIQQKPSTEPETLSLPPSTQTAETKKNQKRCGCCTKKLSLVDFTCTKCSVRFCGTHRLPEEHSCPHDFRKEGQMLLAKANPRVVADKIDHI